MTRYLGDACCVLRVVYCVCVLRVLRPCGYARFWRLGLVFFIRAVDTWNSNLGTLFPAGHHDWRNSLREGRPHHPREDGLPRPGYQGTAHAERCRRFSHHHFIIAHRCWCVSSRPWAHTRSMPFPEGKRQFFDVYDKSDKYFEFRVVPAWLLLAPVSRHIIPCAWIPCFVLLFF